MSTVTRQGWRSSLSVYASHFHTRKVAGEREGMADINQTPDANIVTEKGSTTRQLGKKRKKPSKSSLRYCVVFGCVLSLCHLPQR